MFPVKPDSSSQAVFNPLDHAPLLTFNEHLRRRGVWAARVCSQTGIATCVVLKGLRYGQGVEVPTLTADLNVGSVV